MNEEEATLVTTKFAIDMCKEARTAAIDECAKLALERASRYRTMALATADLDLAAEREYGAEACEHLAAAIRSLHHSHPGLEREE